MNGEIPIELENRIKELSNAEKILEIIEKFQSLKDRKSLIDLTNQSFDLEKKVVPSLNNKQKADVLISTVGLREAPIILSTLILRVREVYLLHTKGSKETAIKVKNDPDLKKRKISFTLKEIDDVDAIRIYATVKDILDKIDTRDKQVVIDPTSGRKAMSAGIASIAFYYGIKMKYLHGIEKMGIIMPFSEQMKEIPNPYSYFGNTEITLLTKAMNSYNFTGAIALHTSFKSKIKNSMVYKLMENLNKFSEIYLQWEQFEHSNPSKKIELSEELNAILVHYKDEISRLNVKSKNQIVKNIEFLKNLEDQWMADNYNMSDKYRIIDLFQNAERLSKRGFYTDALARLYRLLELIVFHLIRHIFDENKINLNRPDEMKKQDLQKLIDKDERYKEVEIEDFRDQKFGVVDQIKVIMYVEKYKPLAERYLANNQSDIRETRNKSLAAHGTSPVSKEHYVAYRRYISEWLNELFKEKEQNELKDQSKFPEFIID